MDSKVYTLRRGRSPARPSPKSRRKLKAVSDEQDLLNDTYNDSPKHLYGLDKVDGDLPPNVRYSEPPYKLKDTETLNEKYGDIVKEKDSFQPDLRPIHYVVFILCLLLACEVVITLDKWLFVTKYDENSAGGLAFSLESLESAMLAHHENVNQMYTRIKTLEENCSCLHENVNSLKLEDMQHKQLISQLQEKILTTVNVVSTMHAKLEDIQGTVNKREKAEDDMRKKRENGLCQGEECKLLSVNVFESINTALEIHRADVLALPDFALESAGGQIHSPHHSSTCDVGVPIIKVFGMRLWQDPRTPQAIINPEVLPGNCWPMKGSNGYIVIKYMVAFHRKKVLSKDVDVKLELAAAIQPTMVTLEHLDQKLDQYSKTMYQSAPKKFEVYAWLHPDGKEKFKLGSYKYKRKKGAIQTFKIKNKPNQPIQYVELRILSNYGNNDCTCLYRFRVHGQSYNWYQFETENHHHNTDVKQEDDDNDDENMPDDDRDNET